MHKNILKVSLMSLAILSFFTSRRAYALEDVLESIGGADRSFSYGHSQAEQVQRFEEVILERNAKEAAENKPESLSSSESESIRFSRSFRAATLYDSNLFSDHNNPKDDLVYLYSPSIGLKLGRTGVTKAYLTMFYDVTYANYSENHKLSHLNQSNTLEMGLRQGKFDIRITNDFKPNSAYDTGARTELVSAGSNHVIAYSDAANVDVTYHWTPKMDVSGDYRYSVIYFPPSSNATNKSVTRYSYQEHEISPAVSYKLTPKVTLSFSGSLATEDYFQNGGLSSKKYNLSSGLSYRLTPKTDLGARAGYDWLDYNLSALPASEGPRFETHLRHEFTPKISGILSMSQSKGQAFDFRQNSDQQTTNFSTSSNDYRADLRWAMTPRMTLDGFLGLAADSRDGFYTFADPENPSVSYTRTLEDQIYSYGVHWGWKPKNAWSYFLSYEFLDKFSSFKNNEYADHRISGSARVSF